MPRATSPPPAQRVPAAKGSKKFLQAAVITALIVAAGTGGAFYYRRYGDKTSADFATIMSTTKELLHVDVPPRLWPKLLVRRPDVMQMVVYATKKDDDSCLAVMSCRPEWTKERGNRPAVLLQSTLQEYFPQFETESWGEVEVRELTTREGSARLRTATTYRTDDHKEVRIVLVENLVTDRGTVAMYFQTPTSSTSDDEVDTLLKSLR